MTSVADLTTPDPRTLAFMPLGVGLGIALTPDSSVQYWESVLESYVLAEDVAEQTRLSFTDLKKAFMYGIFCYEIFTLVHDRSLFVLEQALRDKFVEAHRGGVEMIIEGKPKTITVARYAELVAFIQQLPREKRRLKLIVQTGERPVPLPFNGSLSSLLVWARRRGLLAGQGTRVAEKFLVSLRNSAAHPDSYHVWMPDDAIRSLSDLTEIINQLWGHSTPGGRLYPAPIQRTTVVVAWDPETTACCSSMAQNLANPSGWESYSEFAVVQAVWPGVPPDLTRYDSMYETLPHPTGYLWGPGPRRDALDWLASHPPRADTVDTRGRLFAIRFAGGHLFLPMRPEVAAAQPSGARSGHWYLIGADTPSNAFNHVRSLHMSSNTCTPGETCKNCYAETRAEGGLVRVLDTVGISATPGQHVPDFFVPGMGGGIRSIALG